jgi:hypothetical protein
MGATAEPTAVLDRRFDCHRREQQREIEERVVEQPRGVARGWVTLEAPREVYEDRSER